MSRLFGWGTFDREPLNVYRDKEKKRAGDQARGRRLPEPRATSWMPFERVRDAYQRPEAQSRLRDISERREEKDDGGGGGIFGKALGVGKKVGSKALDVLDASAETTRDALELTPAFGVSKALMPGQDRRAAGGLIENIVESRGNPGQFLESQREDLNQRGFVDRLVTQVALDPSNLVGAGLATKALRGAAATRGGRLSGSILSGLANANQAIDRTQARYAREVIGGVGGYTASALQGGDTQDNLTAAATGVVAGRASRYLPGRLGTPGAAKNFPLGAQITEETPNVERYAEVLERYGLDWQFDDAGVIRVADPERARAVFEKEAGDFFDLTENRRGQFGEVIATFEGDTSYVVKGDPTGTAHDLYWWDENGVRRGGLPNDSYAGRERPNNMTGEQFRAMDDVERLDEILAEGTPDPFKETLRQPWPEGAVIQRFRPQDDEWMAYVEKEWAGKTGGGNNPRAIELGRMDADRWVGERVNPEWTPAATLRAIYTELDHLDTFVAQVTDANRELRARAMMDRFREIADHIAKQGQDVILPRNAGREAAAAADGGRVGVPGAARPSDEGAQAVPLLDDLPEAVPTGSALAPEGDPRYEAFRQLNVGDRIEDVTRPGRFGEVVNVTDVSGRRVGVEVKWDRKTGTQKLDFKAPIRAATAPVPGAPAPSVAPTATPSVARRRAATGKAPSKTPEAPSGALKTGDAVVFNGKTGRVTKVKYAADPKDTQITVTFDDPAWGSNILNGEADIRPATTPASAPPKPAPSAATGPMPRPEGEPAVAPAPGGDAGVVGEQRTATPRGYEYSVPEGGEPQFRRTQTEQSMGVQDAKPTPAPLTAKPKYTGEIADVLDDFAASVEIYHPQLAQPHDALGTDYAKIRSAAKAAARKSRMADIMEANGIEPGDLKDMDKDVVKALRKQANAAAEADIKAVEDEVLKEGFWDPLAESGSIGAGLPEGRPEGGIGGRPEQPSGVPPLPPPPDAVPLEPGPGNPQRAFGQDGPTVDLLEGKPRDTAIADSEAALGRSKVQGIREKVGRAKDKTIEAIRNEKRRTDHIVRERTGYQVDQIRNRAARANLNVVAEGDRWVLEGTGVSIEDIVEGQTEAALAVRNSLTPEQNAVLDEVRTLNDRWNKTIEAHGGTVAKTETATGDYWPRKVEGREVEGRTIEKNKTAGGKRSLGASRLGRRSQESVEAGIEEGIVYGNPWDALKAGVRNKARIAQDNYIARMVEPMAQPAAKGGFGYRALKGNHPLLENVRFVGEADSGAAMLGRERLVFPNDVADALDDMLTPTSLTDTKIGKGISAINSVATPLRASMDVSFLLNQGMGFLQSSPRNAIKALRNSVDVVRSAMGDPDQYYRAFDDEVARGNTALREAGIEEDVGEWLTARGQHYVDEDAVYEFQFPKPIQDLPVVGNVVKWSNETFGRYLNLARQTLNVDELERAVAMGKRGDELTRHMEDNIRATNRMTGWSGSEITGLESIGMFAPRFFRSQFEQIAAAVSKGGIEGQVARRHLMKLATFGTIATVAINERRGYTTDFDPTSNNFLRIRDVGGQDISPFGPFATIIRAAAQGVAGSPGDRKVGDPLGSLERFMRAKASPTLGTLWTLMTEETYDARPVTRNPRDGDFWTGTLPDIARESVPFALQDIVNEGIEPAIKERDPGKLVGGAIGAGLSALGAQSSEVTPAEKRDFRRDKVAAEMFDGAKYDELTGSQKAEVNEDPEVTKHQAEAERRQLEGTGDDRKRAEAQQDFRNKIEANSQFLMDGRDDTGKVFTGNQFRDAYNLAIQQRIGALSVLEEIKGDRAVSGYFQLYEDATRANGSLDFDKLEELQNAYILKNPGVLRKVDETIGTRDNETMREFRKAKVQAAQYYQIPPYQGMTVEDGNKATGIITRANSLVSFGRAPNRAGALAYLVESGEITEAERQLAITAAKNGANPERRAFRVNPANKPFATFYSDLTAAEAAMDAGYATPVASSGGTKRKPAITSSGGRSSRRRSRR